MTSLGRQSVPETGPDSSPHSDLGAMKDQPADGVEIIVELPVPDGNRADQSSVSATLFRFNFDAGGQADADSQAFTIALPTLNQQKVSECWITQGPVLAGQADGIQFAATDHYLVAHLVCAESELEDTERAVRDSYSKLLAFCSNREFVHPVRTWNFMPDINHDNGLERYRQFSVGRAHAFDAVGLTDDKLPAGTAIGTAPGTPLCITVLATKVPLRMVNNSRQVDAFRYPAQYGPRSPSFSRAVLIPGQPNECLLVSGTASVVGHESLHIEDAAAQAEETCTNIAHLVRDAQGNKPAASGDYARATFRVYLRRPGDLDLVRAIHQAHFGAAPTVYLQGYICRQELLLETEAAIWLSQ